MLSTCCGQAATHFLQPWHFSLSTTAIFFAGSMWIAPNGQARSQVPRPRQAYWQALVPLLTRDAATQSLMP